VATIPDAGGARRALCRGTRALLRVAVLGGLVVTAWLLGSATGHADEDFRPPGTGLVRLVAAAPPDGESSGRLSGPSTAGSTVTKVLRSAPVPRLPVQLPVKPGKLSPLVEAVGVPKLLVPPPPPVSRPLPGPAQHPTAIRQAPAEQAVTVPPAAPPVRALSAPAAVRTADGHAPTPIPARAFAHPIADVLDSAPSAPVPASPPGSTTAPGLIGSTGGGAGTKSGPDLAVMTRWAATGLEPRHHRLWCFGASDLPRSPAAQPSTSPD
jgi:hypothetical protein